MDTNHPIFLPASTRAFKDFGFMQAYLSFKPHLPLERHQFGSLITLDDATLKPGAKGFGLHPHQDTEVVTLILQGEVLHIDPNEPKHTGTLKAKGVQLITAGTGITHNEENNALTEPMKALQIWFTPRKKGLTPAYSKMHLTESAYLNKLACVLSPDGQEDSLVLQQDALMYYSKTEQKQHFTYPTQNKTRNLFIYMIEGEIQIAHHTLNKGDGYGLKTRNPISFIALKQTEFVLFDLKSE